MATNHQQNFQTSSRSRFVRAASMFSLARVCGMLLALIRSILIARWVGPEAFGTWTFVTLYEKYAAFANLGTQAGMTRRVPFLRGKGSVKEMQLVLNTVFTMNLFSAIAYSVIVFGCAFFVENAFDANALVVYALVLLLTSWLHTANTFSMSMGLYSLRNRSELLFDILTTLLPLALVYIWSIYGVIIGFGLSACITVVLAARVLWKYLSFELNWRILWDVILTGLPVTANGMLHTLMTTVDRILIAAMLSREVLGVYGVANIGVRILTSIPSAFSQMLFVKFAEMDGQQKTKEYMYELLDKTTAVFSCLFAPLIAMMIIMFPLAVTFLLPRFVEGIPAGKLLIASAFFISVSLPLTNWCVSTGRFMPVLVLKVIVIAVEFVVIHTVIKTNVRLESIASWVLLFSAVYNITMILICNILLEKSLLTGIIHIGKITFPFLSVLAALCIPGFTEAFLQPFEFSLFVSQAVGLMVSLTVSIPCIYWANRRTRFLALIGQFPNVKSVRSFALSRKRGAVS